MNLGERLYRLRTQRGIYQKELAAELHLSISAISSYETGVHSPDIKILEKFARFYNVSTDYLLGRTECMTPIEDMDRKLVGQYTIADLIDAVLGLPPELRQNVANYITLLKKAESTEKK